jgi:membrane-bound lytic murein transglycosylase MltF
MCFAYTYDALSERESVFINIFVAVVIFQGMSVFLSSLLNAVTVYILRKHLSPNQLKEEVTNPSENRSDHLSKVKVSKIDNSIGKQIGMFNDHPIFSKVRITFENGEESDFSFYCTVDIKASTEALIKEFGNNQKNIIILPPGMAYMLDEKS